LNPNGVALDVWNDDEKELAFNYADATGPVTPSWEDREEETIRGILESIDDTCRDARQDRQTLVTEVSVGAVALLMVLTRYGPLLGKRKRVNPDQDGPPPPGDQGSFYLGTGIFEKFHN